MHSLNHHIGSEEKILVAGSYYGGIITDAGNDLS